MRPHIRLWERDRDIISAAGWPKTARQLARIVNGPPKKISERASLLTRAGWLRRTPYLQADRARGNAEWAYYTGARPLERTLPHDLGVAEVHAGFATALRTRLGHSAAFFYPGEVKLQCGLLPDLTVLVCKDDGKHALFFAEYDRGMEAVTRRGGYSVASKLATYAHLFDTGQYRKDLGDALGLVGFRVLLVAPAARLRSLQELIAREGHDFVLLTTDGALRDGLDRPIWRTAAGTLVDCFGRPGAQTGAGTGVQVGA